MLSPIAVVSRDVSLWKTDCTPSQCSIWHCCPLFLTLLCFVNYCTFCVCFFTSFFVCVVLTCIFIFLNRCFGCINHFLKLCRSELWILLMILTQLQGTAVTLVQIDVSGFQVATGYFMFLLNSELLGVCKVVSGLLFIMWKGVSGKQGAVCNPSCDSAWHCLTGSWHPVPVSLQEGIVPLCQGLCSVATPRCLWRFLLLLVVLSPQLMFAKVPVCSCLVNKDPELKSHLRLRLRLWLYTGGSRESMCSMSDVRLKSWKRRVLWNVLYFKMVRLRAVNGERGNGWLTVQKWGERQ